MVKALPVSAFIESVVEEAISEEILTGTESVPSLYHASIIYGIQLDILERKVKSAITREHQRMIEFG